MTNDPQDDQKQLSDGRNSIGQDFIHPEAANARALGEAFADPNSQDDRKIGEQFEASNSSSKKHHRPLKQVITAPIHNLEKDPGSRKVFLLVILGLVITLLLVLILGWIPRHNQQKEADQKARQKKEDPEVEVSRVSRAKESAGLTIPGTTTPLTEASVYARANGYLKQRFVDIGDHVKKGQLLAIIDAPDLDQQVDQAREQLRQSEAQRGQQETQLALTKVTGDRYRILVAKGVFSHQEGDQREADYQNQLAAVAASGRNVEAFRANLRRVIALQSYERVTAPFSGVITQRNVDTGALISASGSAGGSAPTPIAMGQTGSSQQQNAASNNSGSSGAGAALATNQTGGGQGGALFTIAQSDHLRILVSVPESYAGLIHPGQHTSLHFQEFPDQSFFGDVSRTSGAIDQNTRTLLTEIQVTNPNGKLLPGMYAAVTFASGAPGSSLGPVLISGDAIAIRKDRPMVAVITDNKAHLQPVTIGRDYGPEVEILSGLKEGDMIASTFTDDVQEGGRIKPILGKQKASPSPATPTPTPPSGSTQYRDPSSTNQDMRGQASKPAPGQSGQQQSGQSKSPSKTGSQ